MLPARRTWPWLLAFALVAAQALGLAHRVVHAQHGHGHEPGGIASLFDGHDSGSTECRLFDTVNHDAPLALAAMVLPTVTAFFFLDRFDGEFLARWAALFDARGPPSLR
jgi:hypothetical protein